MNFQALALKFSGAMSKLMGLSTPSQNQGAWVTVDGTDVVNGTNGFWSTLWVIIKSSIGDVFIHAVETVVRVLYAIIRWLLTFIDFIFVFIRQLIGMNTDFTSIEEVTQGDVIFQFIFNDSVIRIIRNMLIFSIVLLIIFSIFSIIKSEYEFITQGTGNSKGKILANALRSMFLMVLVPLVAIGSIIMSNAILKSLYMVTSGGDTTMSMGTQVFIISSYDANAYRRYAQKNFKIPITFNFSEVTSSDNLSGYYSDGTIAEMEDALKAFQSQDVWTRGFKTFLMFASNAFLNMDDVDELDRAYLKEDKVSPYHSTYDINLYSRSEEYYAMADVVEYGLRQNIPLYFKTLEEVYESYHSIPASLRHDSDDYMPIGKAGDTYAVSVNYHGGQQQTYSYEYDSRKSVQSQSDGVVFVMAIEREIEVKEGSNIKTYRYYYPVMNGINSFYSDYYDGTKNVVIAKGMFEDGKYPTAIKEEDGVVQFYRDDMNIPMLVDLFPKISYEMPEGSHESIANRLLKGAITALTGVDISQFVPYVYFSIDFFHLFTKTTNVIADLENGRMKIDYNFTSNDFDKANLYKLSDFNLFLLVFASGLLASIMIKILMGLIFRTLDIFTLSITYPAVLATIPIDDGARFQNWVRKFSTKLLSVYAVIVGVNVVLLFSPIIFNINFFTTEDIINYAKLGVWAGKDLTGLDTWGAMVYANVCNKLTQLLFMLVAFASLQPFIKTLGQYLNLSLSKKEEKSASSPIIDDGQMVVNDLQNLPKKIGNFVSGKVLVDTAKKVGDTALDFALPGRALVKEAQTSISNVVMGGKKKADMMRNTSDAFKKAFSIIGQEESDESKKNAEAVKEAEAEKKTEKKVENKGDVTQNGADPGQNTDLGTGNDKDKAVVTGVQNSAEDKDRAQNENNFDGVYTELEKAMITKQDGDPEDPNSFTWDEIKDPKLRSASQERLNNSMFADKVLDTINRTNMITVQTEKKELMRTVSGMEAEAEYNNYLDEVRKRNGFVHHDDEIEALRRMALKSKEIAQRKYEEAKYGKKEDLPINDEEVGASGDAVENMFDKGVQGLDAVGATSFGGKMLSLAGKALLKTGKLAYKVSKTAVKLAGKLTLAVGKLTWGVTKTALKMSGRVVKASAKSLAKFATGEQGLFKTGLQIIGGGISASAIGVSGLTKYGAQFGGRVVKAGLSATGGFAKDFGTTLFAKNKHSQDPSKRESKLNEQVNKRVKKKSSKTENGAQKQEMNETKKDKILKDSETKIKEEIDKSQKQQEEKDKKNKSDKD